MNNLRMMVVGFLVFAAILLGLWLYQESSDNQEWKQVKGPSKSNPALIAADKGSVDTSSDDWSQATTVGKIVADRPETARILDLVGIDYCCGGQVPLEEAATAQKIDPVQLLNALRVVGATETGGEHHNWQQAKLGELIDHIVSTHHTWLRRELPTLTKTTEKVLRVHGDSHPELAGVAETLGRIREAVLPHLNEEEQLLFPALRELANGIVTPNIDEQLAAMRTDHDALGEDLHRLRELTDGFAVPTLACASYREMLIGLAELERDMHQHVHLENNVLLPKALSLLAELSANQTHN